MTDQPDLDAIRAREAAATRGPWSWGGNTDHDDPRLVGGTGRQTVMGMVRRERTADDPETKDFVSYLRETEFYFGDTCRHLTDEEIDERVREEWLSDQWGEPAFDMRLAFRDEHGIMQYARDLAVFAVCPEATSRAHERVYRADIVGLRHPDAVFMEHAREDVRVLLGKVDEQESLMRQATEAIRRLNGELAECIAQRDDALHIVEAFMGQHTYDESSVLNPVTGKPYVEEALRSAAPYEAIARATPEDLAAMAKGFHIPGIDSKSPRKLPVCPGCRHCHRQGEKCADHSWSDSCPYDAGADCGQGANAGMPEPCQPIGCDNGHHLAGCVFAEVDAASAAMDAAVGSGEADRG